MRYRIDNKFVDEEEFWNEFGFAFDNAYKKIKDLTNKEREKRLSECKRLLEEKGEVAIDSKGYKKQAWPNWTKFYKAPNNVFEMEEIIEMNQYDPLYEDAYSIAQALYKAGYRKLEEDRC